MDTIFNTAAMFIGWFVSFIFSIFTAILLDQFGLTMSWYTRPKIIFGLYFCPTLIFSSLFLILLNKYDNKDVSACYKKNYDIIRFILFFREV